MSGYHFSGDSASNSDLAFQADYAETLARWRERARERVESLRWLIRPDYYPNANGKLVPLVHIDRWNIHESELATLSGEFAALDPKFRVDPYLSANDRQSLIGFMVTIREQSHRAGLGTNGSRVDIDAVESEFGRVESICDHIVKSIHQRIQERFAPVAPAAPEAPSTPEAPKKSRQKRNQGKADRCVGVYMDAIGRNETPPKPSEIAKSIGCSRGTASRAIKAWEVRRLAGAKGDAKDRYRSAH